MLYVCAAKVKFIYWRVSLIIQCVFNSTLSVAQVVLYPQFNNPSKFDNDIALLRLMTPSCMPPVVLRSVHKLSSVSNTISMMRWFIYENLTNSRNDSNIGPGNQTVVLGWGVLEEGGRTLPAALQRATIPIVEKTKCTQVRLCLLFIIHNISWWLVINMPLSILAYEQRTCAYCKQHDMCWRWSRWERFMRRW